MCVCVCVLMRFRHTDWVFRERIDAARSSTHDHIRLGHNTCRAGDCIISVHFNLPYNSCVLVVSEPELCD